MKPINLVRGRGILDIQTVTTGLSGIAPNRLRGFQNGVFGAITDGSSNIYAGAAIFNLYWDENGGGGAEKVVLNIAGTLANSGWTQMTIDSLVVLTRASAAFVAAASTTWTWNGVVTNPFGVGGNHPCVFS